MPGAKEHFRICPNPFAVCALLIVFLFGLIFQVSGMNIWCKIETDYYRWALGTYTHGDRQFLISIVKDVSENSGGVWSIEKDERKPDIFEQGGIKFYVMDNLGRSHAFWFDLPYTISIAGHVTRDELKQMINSMFVRK